MLLVPEGTVVDVRALPKAASRGVALLVPMAPVPMLKLETVRSAEVCPAAMVYVPVSVLPVVAAVRVTVAPVLRVTVICPPAKMDSLAVAVMLMLSPTL